MRTRAARWPAQASVLVALAAVACAEPAAEAPQTCTAWREHDDDADGAVDARYTFSFDGQGNRGTLKIAWDNVIASVPAMMQ